MNKKRKNNSKCLEIPSKIKKIKFHLLNERILCNKRKYQESQWCGFIWKKILSYLPWLTRQKFYLNFPSMYMWIERKNTHHHVTQQFKDLKNGKLCLTCGKKCSNNIINMHLANVLLKNHKKANICSSSCLNLYFTQNNSVFRVINCKELAKMKIYEYETAKKIWNAPYMIYDANFLNALFLIHKDLYKLLKYIILDVNPQDLIYYHPSFQKYIKKNLGICRICTLRKNLNKEIIEKKIQKIKQSIKYFEF